MTSDTPNQSSSKQSLSAKKASVLGSSSAGSRSPASRKILLGACILIAGVILLLLFTHSGPKDTNAEATFVTPVNGDLVHSVALFADGQARHFVLRTEDGVGIRYFVLRTPDGMIRTAFDACDVCWQADMGYVQDGDVMICRNCGMRFPSRIIGEVRGGCNPTPLASQAREGDLVIRAGDVLEGRRYFDFGPGSGRG
ncbi:DUF2318 domain-containing protein [Desulfonatronum sp. SC1]|uniref:DUF2318 domain-containing protein n=1 Tax=Desulfonatronum sp. SC1 TaxID=2109626 RepID=UPI000D312870|nr:DUF2318 domain-containing protein [Desulfonatronum sp. SC1]PTN37294.1 DUF2318 domain-containing protein [Desulfonatronum sp. SC1]